MHQLSVRAPVNSPPPLTPPPAGPPAPQPLRPRRAWRRWRVAAACAAAGLLVLAVALVLAVSYRPGWYAPAGIDHSRLRADKRDFVALLDRISAALNEGRSISVELSDKQVNRWIAAQGELPDLDWDLGPIGEPRVRFTREGVKIGGAAQWRGARTVVSVTCKTSITNDKITAYIDDVRLGALPVPLAWVRRSLAAFGLAARSSAKSDAPSGRVFENRFVWANGKRPARIAGVELSEGRARIILEPLKPATSEPPR